MYEFVQKREWRLRDVHAHLVKIVQQLQGSTRVDGHAPQWAFDRTKQVQSKFDKSTVAKAARPNRMLFTVDPPSAPPGAPNRIMGCAVAIEPSLRALTGTAERAGWLGDEVSLALFDLAVNRIVSMSDDGTTVYEAAAFALKQLNQPR